MPAATVPQFPDDVPTVPLLVIDYALVEAGNEAEIGRLWQAATQLGFWYLKNHGADEEVSAMFEMGDATMQLPLEEKMAYEQGNDGNSFGYKAAGANATDEYGSLDFVEFINVAKDDALAYPSVVHRQYPSTVRERMVSTVAPFVRKSIEVNNTLLSAFNDRLGLPAGTLLRLHALDESSGSETRCIKTPPSQTISQDKAAIGAHTDFGSLSFLHHKLLGGLQVLPPGTEAWKYVKPIPGHAICNVGDALSIFSGGILRSNLHRVVPPPKAQAAFERWSLVFFTRPGYSQLLEPLVNDSPLIAAAVGSALPGRFSTGATAKEWFTRRIKNQRIANRAGPETWRESRGTEHKVEAI
ncbi:Clavaminate synthase-like protein [Exidia glandulosa HHB12029]|uniref:Clavaminate synthase-like protein n=1 Tax=Exidia glandulosa HHB12029 TaxID=1314781 RepID=A0A165JEP9_EXIGL|nr:Clavaminate synthase-like protein [Exidia glandulosa HHB12029]